MTLTATAISRATATLKTLGSTVRPLWWSPRTGRCTWPTSETSGSGPYDGTGPLLVRLGGASISAAVIRLPVLTSCCAARRLAGLGSHLLRGGVSGLPGALRLRLQRHPPVHHVAGHRGLQVQLQLQVCVLPVGRPAPPSVCCDAVCVTPPCSLSNEEDLTAVTDSSGNTLRIRRDTNRLPVRVVAPDNQVTHEGKGKCGCPPPPPPNLQRAHQQSVRVAALLELRPPLTQDAFQGAELGESLRNI